MTKQITNQTKKLERGEIDLCIQKFLDYLKQQGFSNSILQRYESYLIKFKNFCILNNFLEFLSEDTILQYLQSLVSKHNYTIQFSRKVLFRFKDYTQTGTFKIKYLPKKNMPKSKQFCESLTLLASFLADSNIKNSTITLHETSIRLFLIYLENNNIFSFNDLSCDDEFSYINTSNFAPSTKALRSHILKKFFNFTYNQGITTFSGNSIFPKINYDSRERTLSFYSSEEIKKLISSIDTSTVVGKRDYAIVLLAATLGLRACDIINLKVENFNWHNKLIKIIQKKTNKELIQPFTDEIFFAILDYLKNARPTATSDNLFVSFTPPHYPLSTVALTRLTTKYFKLANIDISSRKHGIHSLRHSFSNNLLHNNVSFQNISASLGHSVISTTTMYTNIDVDTLKLLSLEVN